MSANNTEIKIDIHALKITLMEEFDKAADGLHNAQTHEEWDRAHEAGLKAFEKLVDLEDDIVRLAILAQLGHTFDTLAMSSAFRIASDALEDADEEDEAE